VQIIPRIDALDQSTKKHSFSLIEETGKYDDCHYLGEKNKKRKGKFMKHFRRKQASRKTREKVVFSLGANQAPGT